jgi:hypothetical protein
MVFSTLRLAALLLFALTATGLAGYDGSPAEKAKWGAFCVNSLNNKERLGARRVYCRCMSEIVDTTDFRRLYEWERIFPPAHRNCFDEAGFRPGGR